MDGGTQRPTIQKHHIEDAILRMDDVRKRHPHVWTETAKQKRREQWTPYSVDESKEAYSRRYNSKLNKRNIDISKTNKNKVNQTRNKDEGSFWFWTGIGAAVLLISGGIIG